MGLTKQYVRYTPSGLFNVVGSPQSNIVFLELRGQQGKFCAVGACENVIVWDLRKSEKVIQLVGDKHEVTLLSPSPDKQHLAVGYTDGAVKIFSLQTGELQVTLSGHKSAVTALNYDCAGVRLVSGSKDTDVIIWDIVNECGLFRLKGHKGVVTQAVFMKKHPNLLVTSSKDTFVKFWDLDTQHCFKTLVGHRTEVWDFVIVQEDTRLVTGSGDSELRVWQIQFTLDGEPGVGLPAKRIKLEPLEEEENDDSTILSCVKIGSIMRQGQQRVVSMVTDPTSRLLGCHGPDNLVEIFQICTNEEIRKHLQKRQKRARKKASKEVDQNPDVPHIVQSVEDEFRRVNNVKCSSKLRCFDCLLDGSGNAKIVCLLTNNTLETCQLELSEKMATPMSVSALSQPGHRSDVRALCFSSDNTAIMSASAESVKIWNRSTLQCIRTMQSEYGLCSLFAPGDRHVIIGTKSGKLQIFDIAYSSLLESVNAHSGPVWSIYMAPDKKSIVSGSADHEVKFWDFELMSDDDESSRSRRLTLVHTRTLKMTDDILSVRYSSDHRLLAVALLDNTVKVFFVDTLKFFLSLYGHKLPVLCMDISTDNSLIVTGSADRNVKLWGLDFGDCHKSIFAHDDSVMAVQFVPKTHLFFTVGKDRKLKQWDGDTFAHILTLVGHHSEVWCLAVSPSGNFLVTGSHDKSLRLWEKSQEPLVLEEEQEMEREKEYEETIGKGDEPVIPGEVNEEAAIAGKKTVETVKAAERIMEALELYKEEMSKLELHQAECSTAGKELPLPPLPPIFMAFNVSTPIKYVLEVIKRVKSSELEEALLVLPFSYVTQLLKLLHTFIESGWQVELACRCLFFLLRVHQGQITSNQLLLPILNKLKTSTVKRVTGLKDCVGFNLAGLQFLKSNIEEKEEVKFFADATEQFKQRKKKLKKRAVITL